MTRPVVKVPHLRASGKNIVQIGATMSAIIVAALLCSACASFLEESPTQIPAEFIAAKNSGARHRLVVLMPGRNDTLAELKRAGIAEAIQRGMPDADVILVEFMQPRDIRANGAQRLHDEIVQPMKVRGYREIYLAGVEMGGMGALMFERAHANEIQGLILMSPYLGDAGLIKEVQDAGGLARWNPGPLPAEINEYTAAHENWRLIKSWVDDPARARNVWLICGQEDRIYPAATVVASILPRQNFIAPPGNGNWKMWTEGASEAFAAIDAGNKPELAKR